MVGLAVGDEGADDAADDVLVVAEAEPPRTAGDGGGFVVGLGSLHPAQVVERLVERGDGVFVAQRTVGLPSALFYAVLAHVVGDAGSCTVDVALHDASRGEAYTGEDAEFVGAGRHGRQLHGEVEVALDDDFVALVAVEVEDAVAHMQVRVLVVAEVLGRTRLEAQAVVDVGRGDGTLAGISVFAVLDVGEGVVAACARGHEVGREA